MELPPSFRTLRAGRGDKSRAIVVREDLDAAIAGPLLDRIAAVGWDALYHAYGPATDVPAQLAAVVVGDAATREEAWWNLWGNIHHQGTIYAATVPAVAILFALAGWPAHPDREQALSMLREIGAAEGVDVWRYDADGAIVKDPQEGTRLLGALRPALVKGARPLLDRWREEPEQPVRRALLWLLSVLPEVRAQYEPLVAELLAPQHRAAWEIALAGAPDSQDDADAVSDLEDWIHRGAG